MTHDSNLATREYFDSIFLETRYIDSDLPDTKFELWGETFDTPIMTAALSHLHNICEDGMVQFAKGANDAGALHWVGMGDPEDMERIFAAAKTVRIIKPHADNKDVLWRIEHANRYGAFAVGMDIDHSFSHDGKYDVCRDLPMKPKSVEELKMFVQASKVPFIAKGVLSVQDALKCAEAGVGGIVISHHHGRMGSCIPPLMALPKIKAEIGNSMKIFVDCGIESGMDAYKALALGADAVSVGRHLMTHLADGATGVTKRINAMTGELSTIMARTSVPTLKDFDPSVLYFRNF
jgi:isopentenyl diphosphate isomerase/L-lactate dehydrogenase-like FMN-dependent dehydrogenase